MTTSHPMTPVQVVKAARACYVTVHGTHDCERIRVSKEQAFKLLESAAGFVALGMDDGTIQIEAA